MGRTVPQKRGIINISVETKSQLDSLRAQGQSYNGIILQLVKFWKEKNSGLKSSS